ncbi:NrfD/PsrC family molybdoenzyme membrane anchor subunit [Aromatoleum aromaticum]|uniref:Subunit C of a molybdoprotein, similar to that of tetrathionate reductase or polysulphide reductase n=1 Tax=Aromatoleum aromaticum (strain DSM 19018 / LMG 30748 / EbN1) TaxID=76114 RepID=Q5P4B4_AROAE|nr:NrfD/PsrC family molybdoenzyme membrane anchor subunit [Aromatoleum aromaticum]NMG56128.1 tetrathionate reductase [Aromatoleum aromaticum]CAI07849.1 subunit C of a molybdoprotein, similar to that of tetrathionate reductase or polysulphide reductase [Aromatoleum aromaticum EbN1]
MNADIVETVNVAREIAWLPWAVQYFFLIGLSYGAFLVSLPGLVFRRNGWEGISRLALLAALVCGLTAPVALLADLHQPARFWHFYAYFTPTSWMSWGAFFIPVYLTGLILYAWLAYRPLLARHADEGGRLAGLARRIAYGGHESRNALVAAALLAFVGAALVALYTGVEVMLVRARPLWHTPLLPVQFFVTALAGGLGLTLLFNRALPGGGEPGATCRMATALAATQFVALLVGGVWLALGLSGLSPTHAQALAEVAPSANWQVSAVWAISATVVTLLLAWKRPASGLLIGLLALHSAWMMRWTIFIGGQEVPKTGAGYYSYQLPLGPEGLMGIVGTVGLWIFLFVVLTTLLPLDRLGKAGV